MVYSHVGRSDLFLILGCMNSNGFYLSFSSLHSTSLFRADTTIFAKLNNPSLSNIPLVSIKPVIEMNKPPTGLIEDLR